MNGKHEKKRGSQIFGIPSLTKIFHLLDSAQREVRIERIEENGLTFLSYQRRS